MPIDRRRVLVFVVDGLRPDSITAEDTPTLVRLRAEGVELVNSHAVFPTVTRVNAAAIATGTQPGTNGLVGNQMVVPAVDEQRAFVTPSSHAGRPNTRFAILNPLTTFEDLVAILDTM